MSRQYFMDLSADPQTANATALTATTIEDLWSAATYSPIQAGEAGRAGKTYEITAFGIMSTGASGTLIITPQTTTGSNTLGASAAITVPVSLTNVQWFLKAMAIVRTVGSTGTMMLGGCFWSQGVTTNASPGANLQVPFGGTSATFDTTVLNGITIRKTLSVAGSMTTMGAILQSIN